MIDATTKLEVYKEKIKDSKLNSSWFIPALQQKETLASSQLEGTQAALDGVRVGNVPSYMNRYKQEGTGQSWFPKSWTDKDIRHAGEHTAGLKGNRHVPDGKVIYGIYKGVRVCVIKTHGKMATVFPDSKQNIRRNKNVAEKTQSREFIQALRNRLTNVTSETYCQQNFKLEHMRKWVDYPEYVRSIEQEIDYAEGRVDE